MTFQRSTLDSFDMGITRATIYMEGLRNIEVNERPKIMSSQYKAINFLANKIDKHFNNLRDKDTKVDFVYRMGQVVNNLKIVKSYLNNPSDMIMQEEAMQSLGLSYSLLTGLKYTVEELCKVEIE